MGFPALARPRSPAHARPCSPALARLHLPALARSRLVVSSVFQRLSRPPALLRPFSSLSSAWLLLLSAPLCLLCSSLLLSAPLCSSLLFSALLCSSLLFSALLCSLCSSLLSLLFSALSALLCSLCSSLLSRALSAPPASARCVAPLSAAYPLPALSAFLSSSVSSSSSASAPLSLLFLLSLPHFAARDPRPRLLTPRWRVVLLGPCLYPSDL